MSKPTNRCRGCGRTLAKGATLCGNCVKARTSKDGTYKYQRTHVHVWPDGHRTIEAGVTCEEATA